MVDRKSGASIAAMWLHRAESVILVLIAIVLILLAVLLLGNSAVGLAALLNPGPQQDVRTLAINVLDTVLLVMMTMEIVYTVAVSLESHSLVAEPFLIIGAIAAIRRMLVITAESTAPGGTSPLSGTQSTQLLAELALLALIVIAMATSIYVLRRSSKYLSPAEQEEERRRTQGV